MADRMQPVILSLKSSRLRFCFSNPQISQIYADSIVHHFGVASDPRKSCPSVAYKTQPGKAGTKRKIELYIFIALLLFTTKMHEEHKGNTFEISSGIFVRFVFSVVKNYVCLT